ncbi:MAG TPA: sugar ABC transporter ATP-binding protein [Bryobacteraceae bacterium]|jgi:ABC-type sugar transport system ATPase subunit|nr:sugar ABC transporter ATP-binding protein [Bryobacteraceae bacterium]
MLLELKGIRKSFGGVAALRDGTLSVEAGEAHLLMGENGAGKSTLMKIAAGLLQPDGGEILWKGKKVRFRTPAEAAANGIAMVHQESLLARHLSVAENIFLGREERLPFGWVKRRQMIEKAARIIEEHHFPLRAEWMVDRLSPAGKQMVEICRAIQQGTNLLIFDEPTSSLSAAETDEVFRIVKTLKLQNAGVIYITHRLDELREVGDRVTVLRDGQTVHTDALSNLDLDRLIQLMVGREVASIYERKAIPPGEEILRVEGLNRKGVLRDISFSVRAGEIVGLAGLIGAGRTELCRALFGLDGVDSGEVKIAGKPVRVRSARQGVSAGLALIPEDRQRSGLAALLPISHNMTLASVDRISKLGFLNHAAERDISTDYIGRLRLKCSSARQAAGKLSGGNQQKVVIAKWLVRGARVFLFDEPTRGIDVGAKAEVFEVMDSLARSGAAILMVSSEMAELLQTADRILVMRQGRISGELPGHTTQEAIMRLAGFDAEVPGAAENDTPGETIQ